MVDKNLFLYDLAVVAIFKDEGRYLKEWLDYHLLAGVEHFYLYNNDSADDYQEVLAPYIEKNLVTLTDLPGKMMQFPAYNDAIEKYRFECRYMAFIDLDEFIFPKTDSSVVEVVDEILSKNSNAASLVINWQMFGSNGQEKADYSRGVLERFTRRAPSDWTPDDLGNAHVKTVANPRLVHYIFHPHFAYYFYEKFAVNSNGEAISSNYTNAPVLSNKIVINHYHNKSLEEYLIKINRGSACCDFNHKSMERFHEYNRNEIFDDGILKYRIARAEKFSFENEDKRIIRVINSVVRTLTQNSPDNMPQEFFKDKLETFLACRAIAERFQIKIGKHLAEELALVWIYYTLIKINLTTSEIRQLLKELPKILLLNFSVCENIKSLIENNILTFFLNGASKGRLERWWEYHEMEYIQKLLRLIK